MAVVAIDPGHGGSSEVGGSSPNNAVGFDGTKEKDLTLDIGLRAKALLESDGTTVVMTRMTDKNVGLTKRANIARDAGADAYISIHFNGWNGVVQGTETYIHSKAGDASMKLAKHVQTQMLQATGLTDRHVKKNSFGTLNPSSHHSKTAACLVEVSFLDVVDECKRLKNESYRNRIAEAIRTAVNSYLQSRTRFRSLPRKDAKPTPPQDGFEVEVRMDGA